MPQTKILVRNKGRGGQHETTYGLGSQKGIDNVGPVEAAGTPKKKKMRVNRNLLIGCEAKTGGNNVGP